MVKIVFISGSIKIKALPVQAIEKLNSIISKKIKIIVGDARGIDLNIQKYLLKNEYKNVVVYYAGKEVRNNIGKWETKNILAQNNEKGRELYTLKDISMAQDADYGLMIWDGISKGTLANIQEMQKLQKKFYVILNSIIVNEKQIDNIIQIDQSNRVRQLDLF